MDALLALGLRTGRIVRVSLPDGRVETLTDQAGPTPDGVVVEGGVVYWTTMGVPEVDPTEVPGEASRDYSRRNGGVHAIGLDGIGKRDVVPDGTVTTGKQLTSDGAGTLYWGDREGCRVTRVRVDGTGLTDLVVNERGDWTAECVGVAVLPTRGHLFWTQKGPANGGKGRIFRAGIDIPPGETAANRSDIETLWDRLPEPIDLHISGDWLYWTDRGAPPRGNTLNRAPIPSVGARGTPPEMLATGFAEAIGVTTDDEAGLVYVSDLGGKIRMVPMPGGPSDGEPPRVIAAFGEPITGLASVLSCQSGPVRDERD
jgi:hypothetical protein